MPLVLFTAQCVWRRVPSLLKKLFTRERDLMLSASNSSIFSFSEGHPVAYFFFLVSSFFLSILLSFTNNVCYSVFPVKYVTNPVCIQTFYYIRNVFIILLTLIFLLIIKANKMHYFSTLCC